MAELKNHEWFHYKKTIPQTPLYGPIDRTSFVNNVRDTYCAFDKAQRQGFCLQDVTNAKLAQRRRLKKSTSSTSRLSSSNDAESTTSELGRSKSSSGIAVSDQNNRSFSISSDVEITECDPYIDSNVVLMERMTDKVKDKTIPVNNNTIDNKEIVVISDDSCDIDSHRPSTSSNALMMMKAAGHRRSNADSNDSQETHIFYLDDVCGSGGGRGDDGGVRDTDTKKVCTDVFEDRTSSNYLQQINVTMDDSDFYGFDDLEENKHREDLEILMKITSSPPSIPCKTTTRKTEKRKRGQNSAKKTTEPPPPVPLPLSGPRTRAQRRRAEIEDRGQLLEPFYPLAVKRRNK